MPESPRKMPDSSQHPDDPQPTKKDRWLDNLARRSTGLPDDTSPTDKETDDSDKSLWTYAGLGIQFAATTAIFTYGGYLLDQWLGWFPWCTVSLAMMAVIGGLYLLIKEAMTPPKPPTR